MTDLVIGGRVDEALAVQQEFLALMQGRGKVEPDEEVLEDAVAFAGVAKYPARVKCALLGWMALKDAAAQAARDRRHAHDAITVDRVDDVTEAMRDVVDPELGINVVDLGLVYGVTVDQNRRRHAST